MLEPYDGKLSRTVLRREGGGNTADPADYSPLVNRLKGQVIKISPNSTQFINPMDINANYSEEDLPNAINRTIRSICADYNKEEESKAKEENRDPVLLPKFSCHILRHTFCTRFCENETNLKVIQEIMGHADISTTMDVYAEATQEKKKESMASLQSALLVR